MKKTIYRGSIRGWMAALVGASISGAIFAQTVPNSSYSDVVAGYLQERCALGQEAEELMLEGASPQQMSIWEQGNAAEFELEDQLGEEITLALELQPRPLVDWVLIPANASGILDDFLTSQAALANGFSETYNQFLAGMPLDATQDQVSQMEQQFEQAFEQQYASTFAFRQQLSQSVAAAAESAPLQVPGTPLIPVNATPQLRAYLILRNGLRASMAQTWNQYLGADPGMREAAMQQWEQRNSSEFNQINQMTQQISDQIINQ